ncbi:histidine kinase N-terminal 7TM domain-containing protein [Halostella salina]|uniref:histidine kinase N-terminal 7TM domain-containing protein n=1 Tax=Halostella salina TaxID=1547897 RepID=UPI000EF7593C|nr:histidine kinase N-terminal 7TM domain-containing protein [Halostella salina]
MALDPYFVGTIQAVAGAVALLFVWIGYRNRDKSGSWSFVVFTLGVFLWATGLAGDNFTAGFGPSFLAYRTALLGVELAAIGWLLLAMEITGRGTLTGRLLAVLGGWLVVMQLLIWTNPAQFVFGSGTALDDVLLRPEPNLGFWLHGGVSYLLAVVSIGLLAGDALLSTGARRTQNALLALAAVPIIVSNLVTVADIVRYDLSPFGFLVSAFVFAVVLYRGQFLDIVPVARRTAMEQMTDAVVTLDEDNRVIDCNGTARRLFDVGDDWFGLAVRAFFDPLGPAIDQHLEDSADNERELSATVDGEKRHFTLTISPIGDDFERGRVLVLHDITAQKRRERELERKNEFLDEFASVVSHDVATPLGVVENKARLIEMTGDTSHAEDIYDATTRVQSLIDQLEELARQGKRVGDVEAVEFEAVVREAWRTVESPSGSLTVESTATIEADRDRLRQLLENLLSNAVEHGAGETEPVSITAGVLSNGFYVADDGPGIPESDADAAFERGFTTGSDTTGLGLAIVRRIVDGHGWVVEMTESEDGGARFEITGVSVSVSVSDDQS